ncbi:hypothetical protein EDD16DRAFT_1519594 [Pisolithus croceorrhizus]|nr:hypothetical protein EDD16DRAFT_1519594 [Pisolithus croceorrhizus]
MKDALPLLSLLTAIPEVDLGMEYVHSHWCIPSEALTRTPVIALDSGSGEADGHVPEECKEHEGVDNDKEHPVATRLWDCLCQMGIGPTTTARRWLQIILLWKDSKGECEGNTQNMYQSLVHLLSGPLQSGGRNPDANRQKPAYYEHELREEVSARPCTHIKVFHITSWIANDPL